MIDIGNNAPAPEGINRAIDLPAQIWQAAHAPELVRERRVLDASMNLWGAAVIAEAVGMAMNDMQIPGERAQAVVAALAIAANGAHLVASRLRRSNAPFHAEVERLSAQRSHSV
jgi:hypothetical protein